MISISNSPTTAHSIELQSCQTRGIKIEPECAAKRPEKEAIYLRALRAVRNSAEKLSLLVKKLAKPLNEWIKKSMEPRVVNVKKQNPSFCKYVDLFEPSDIGPRMSLNRDPLLKPMVKGVRDFQNLNDFFNSKEKGCPTPVRISDSEFYR